MSDEEVGQSQLSLQIVQQVQNLVLHEHVQSRHGLVQDDHFGVERKRTRNGNALTLTTGKLVRVTTHGASRQGNQVEQFGDALCAQLLLGFAMTFKSGDGPRFGIATGRLRALHFLLSVGLRPVAVDAQRLFNDSVDRIHRVQRTVGVLEHGLKATTQREKLCLAVLRGVLTVEEDLARGRLQQVEDHIRGS